MAELFVSIDIEPLPEGGYLATSRALQGLVAQGRTVAETMEIAQDVARRLIESCVEHKDPLPAQIRRALAPRRKKRSTIKIPVTV
ncbi:MAG: type II toxin-antitoxin system HicB family antitoxin [Planctomycetota bacterium]|nr:MAG: type II toxin-antitoxin system HicB family antitoxin [Planctomycetota bacterium]